MRSFLIKVSVFTLPALAVISTVIYLDFFKVLGFQDYYTGQVVGLNREMITTTTYNHYREQENFNSFIFGSSRSQPYQCENWLQYLDDQAKPFHFDASGEGIWGISKKVEYIDELGDTIKNALVVIDRSVLEVTYPRDGHIFISMPCYTKSSPLTYYATFLSASLNLKFLTAYFDYSLFNTYRSYMGTFIRTTQYDHQVNSTNCDIKWGWETEIELDSATYYSNLISKGIFYERPRKEVAPCRVTPEEKEQLRSIKTIFKKHNTNFKIIISPIYDQVPMEAEQLELLQQLFGTENIFDFSGKNRFTEAIHNYYETSHYRPHVANELMNMVYTNTRITTTVTD